MLTASIQSNGVFTLRIINNDTVMVTPGNGVLTTIMSSQVTMLEKITDETIVTVPGIGVLFVTSSSRTVTLELGATSIIGVLSTPIQTNGGFTIATNDDYTVVVIPGVGLLTTVLVNGITVMEIINSGGTIITIPDIGELTSINLSDKYSFKKKSNEIEIGLLVERHELKYQFQGREILRDGLFKRESDLYLLIITVVS
jgi:hypothetical protein